MLNLHPGGQDRRSGREPRRLPKRKTATRIHVQEARSDRKQMPTPIVTDDRDPENDPERMSFSPNEKTTIQEPRPKLHQREDLEAGSDRELLTMPPRMQNDQRAKNEQLPVTMPRKKTHEGVEAKNVRERKNSLLLARYAQKAWNRRELVDMQKTAGKRVLVVPLRDLRRANTPAASVFPGQHPKVDLVLSTHQRPRITLLTEEKELQKHDHGPMTLPKPMNLQNGSKAHQSLQSHRQSLRRILMDPSLSPRNDGGRMVLLSPQRPSTQILLWLENMGFVCKIGQMPTVVHSVLALSSR